MPPRNRLRNRIAISYPFLMLRRAAQITDTILMVRPAAFGSNPETAKSNAFQSTDSTSPDIQSQALAEFDATVKLFSEAGIKVVVVEDCPTPPKPDSVFPNNWISFHEDGHIVLYPMLSELRRLERQNPVLDHFSGQLIDLSKFEAEGRFLEGTGSMILDRENGIVYACESPRTDASLVGYFSELFGYHPVIFNGVDRSGMAIYHTNVMMALGEEFVVICLEAIPGQAERRLLQNCFAETGKEIIEIDLTQMERFAGNMLQLRNANSERFIALSKTAYSSLNEAQHSALARHGKLLVADIPTIEKYGGGSMRCMLAEVFTNP